MHNGRWNNEFIIPDSSLILSSSRKPYKAIIMIIDDIKEIFYKWGKFDMFFTEMLFNYDLSKWKHQ